MSHGATVGGQTHTQTRKQANAGKKTGVAGRRSRWTKEGKIGGLGQAVKRHYSKDHPPAEAIRSVETFWNNLSHEWFGTNKNTFPYTIDKGKPSNFELAQYGAKKFRKTMPMDHIAIPGRVLPLRQDDRDSPIERLEKPRWKEPIIPPQQQEYDRDGPVEQPFEPPKEVVEEPKESMRIMPDAPISLPSHFFGSPAPTAKSIINKRTVSKRMRGY